MGNRLRTWKRSAVFTAGMIALLAVVFFPVWWKGEALFARDLYNFHYPLWKLTADQFARTGRIPLWNPAANFGQNMAADPNYLVLYPPAWIRFFVDPLAALHIFIIGHLLLGGILCRALMKKWGFGAAIAEITGFGYVACGATLSLTCVLNLVPWIVYTPLFLLTFHSLLTKPDFRSSARLGLVGALAATIFEPFMVLGLALCTLANGYGMICRPLRSRAHWGRVVAWTAGGLVLAALISAPILRESARNLSLSARSVENQGDRDLYARHPAQLAALFIPNPFQVGFGMERTYRGGEYSNGQEPFLLSVFLGVSTLLLVPFAFPGKKRRMAVAAATLFLTLIFLSAGPNLPLSSEILRRIPLVGQARYPDKLMFFASATWLVLAACGLAALRREKPKALRLVAPRPAVGASLCAGAALLACAVPGASAATLLPWSLVSATGVAFVCLNPGRVCSSWRIGLVGALLVLEWTGGNAYVTPSAPREIYTENVPILDAIHRREGGFQNFRVACDSFPSNCRYKGKTNSIAWYYRVFRQAGLPYPGYGYGPLYGFDTVFDNLDPLAMASLRQVYPSLSQDDRQALCRRTGIRWLLSPRRQPNLHLEGIFSTGSEMAMGAWRSDGSVVRATVLTAFSPARIQDDVLDRLLHQPPGIVALSEQTTGPGGSISAQRTGVDYPATVVRDDGDYLVVETSAPQSGALVLRDTYDAGWKAYVDGKRSRLLLADYLFRGVIVPAGRHRVVFSFFPPGWNWMLPLSGVALAIAAACGMGPRKRQTSG